MKKFYLILLVSIFLGCSDDDDTSDPIFCTEEARPGLEITILDGIAGNFLVEGVTVIAQDNNYVETLQPGDTSFFGAVERPGSYVITASKEGYFSTVSEVIIVGEDACHVITERKELILTKQ